MKAKLVLLVIFLMVGPRICFAQENWLQFKYDSRHSGNVPERTVATSLGLVGAVGLSDAIFTAPVIHDGRVYVVDGAGMAFCFDAKTLQPIWKFEASGGKFDINNVSSPAIVGRYLHFGTTAGSYYVLDAAEGTLIRKIPCGEPVFSTPVVSGGRVYFATLGARVHAVLPDGTIQWSWDFVKEVLGFTGDRWSGEDWRVHKQGRVTWQDHFCCSRNISMYDKILVVPAGGRTIFLEDAGSHPELRAIGLIPNYAGKEYPAAFGQSIGEEGEVYVQWHRRDNAGRVEILKLGDDGVRTDYVRGTETAIHLPGLLSFCSVSVRGRDVYRCKPEEGFGFARHVPGEEKPKYLGGYPSICPPILLKDSGIFGGLDGVLYVAPLSDTGKPWSFETAFGKAITAPVAVANGRIYFGCEDGYLYVLGPGGQAPLPSKDLEIHQIRSPLTGDLTDPKYDWSTNFGNLANTNANDQGIEPPLKIAWIRRHEGTVKHLPVCGGGRMYTHTAEGQIFAVEQETGRLLWRRYSPGTYLSFTSPIYHDGLLLVPQAGMKRSELRCLDAATGELLWETPFTGSPSWSRQAPPVIHEGLAIYASGSGRYAAQGTEKAFIFKGDPQPRPSGSEVMSWIYTHNNPYYPKDNKPLIWAWDLKTGKEVWKKDFSRQGTGGNDCGLCLMDGKLYYSTFFGYSASARERRGLPPGPNGLTAAFDPQTGNVLWSTTEYYVTAGCTLSAADGRLYLGGYNQADEATKERYIFCLDAKDGSLVWRSDPVRSAVNVVTITKNFLFSNETRGDGHVIDKRTGKIVSRFDHDYNCTRFSCSGSFLMGANMDMIDLSKGNTLVSSGPAVDSRECLGSTVSGGRIFYISQASGLQVSQRCGPEARTFESPWK